MTPERVVGIGFVALLHVIVIWAILTGLVPKLVQAVQPKDITIIDIKKKPDDLALRKPPEFKAPTLDPVVTVQPPLVDIQRDPTPIAGSPPTPPVPQQRTSPPAPDTIAISISGTHTTPPYPALDRRLGNQGTVELKLTISPQGAVMAADIVKSSGFTGLDQAAQSWVQQHWKYKPATQGGVPVASTATAAVVFNIRNAG